MVGLGMLRVARTQPYSMEIDELIGRERLDFEGTRCSIVNVGTQEPVLENQADRKDYAGNIEESI